MDDIETPRRKRQPERIGHNASAAGFFEVRRHVYNLYPLLVHAVLFGGGYGDSVDRTLRRFIG